VKCFVHGCTFAAIAWMRRSSGLAVADNFYYSQVFPFFNLIILTPILSRQIFA